MRSVGLIVLALAVVPCIVYLLTLRRALLQCSPEARKLEPNMVWLMLIPVVNLVWQFVLVVMVASSLSNEFARRGVSGIEANPGQTMGIAMCVLAMAGLIPHVGLVAMLAAFVCWISYWAKIGEYSRKLAAPPVAAAPAAC